MVEQNRHSPSSLWNHRSPPRRHGERPALPGRDSPLRRIAFRAYALIAAVFIAMAIGLFIAKKVLVSDWADKTQAAKAAAAERAAKAEAERERIAHDAADAALEPLETLRRQAAASWLYVDGRVDGRRTLRTLARFGTEAGLPENASWRILGTARPARSDRALSAAALRMAGDDPRTLNAWALRDMELGDHPSAIRRLRALLALHPGTPSALYNLALCHIYLRQPAPALAALSAYLGQRPRDEAALRLQTALLVQLDQAPLALSILETHVSAVGRPTSILLDAAYLEARAGHSSAAIRHLEAAIPAVPLSRIIQVYNTPDFQQARLTAAGQALTAKLAALARSAAASPLLDGLPSPSRPLRRAKRN